MHRLTGTAGSLTGDPAVPARIFIRSIIIEGVEISDWRSEIRKDDEYGRVPCREIL